MKRTRVAGVGETQLPTLDVGDDIKTGREHRRARLFENHRESAVDAGEQLSRVGREPRMFFHEPADHPGDERGTHAVSHHVANQNAGRFLAHWENAEKIAAHVTGGKIQAEKTQSALLVGRAGRDSWKPLRQQSDLKFACHLQFLFHLLILFAQLPSPLLHALLELGIEGEQFRLRAVARRFRPVDASADNA